MKNNGERADANNPMRRIKLKLEGEELLILPEAEGDEPVSMIKIHMSMLDWLQRIALSFHERHGRCFVVLLMLDIESREWGCCVPTQRAAEQSARWRLNANDLPEISATQALGGTFQMRVAPDEADMLASVPPLDGFHFVLRLLPKEARLYAFLGVGGECRPVAIDLLVRDDWQALIDSLTERIIFE